MLPMKPTIHARFEHAPPPLAYPARPAHATFLGRDQVSELTSRSCYLTWPRSTDGKTSLLEHETGSKMGHLEDLLERWRILNIVKVLSL
jgi:hypothetical protein